MPTACILSTVDMSRMTMVSVYIDYFERNHIPYDIIYVDRYQEKPAFAARNLHVYHAGRYANSPFPIKLMHYWNMRPFVRKTLRENKYDFVVVWGELAAFLFADVLKAEVPGRYCLNIRDYFYNNVFFVRHRLGIAIRSAAFCTVSSQAYLQHLPAGDFMMLHSLNPRLLSGMEPRRSLRERGKPIRILYLGLIARMEYVHRLIDALGNDARFELIFAGIGSEQVDRYIEGKHLTNIKTFGQFPQSETGKYLQMADVLYNLYGHGSRHFDLALSIKLYYAIYLNLPIMVFDQTHTKDVAERCGLAFTVREDDFSALGDRIWHWYHGLDPTQIGSKCDAFLQQVAQSHQELDRRITNLMQGNRE